MPEDPDREDARRTLAGDLSAFEGIVRRWQSPLVNLAYRFCRNRARAEEMAQEAFVHVYRRLDRYREEAAFSTWLFAVALNLYRSRARRYRPILVPLDAAPEPSDPRAAGEAMRADVAEAVRAAVCLLPARYRDAVVLFYFLEMDVARAAAILGVPEGTVKARLHRGRRMLRDRIERALSPRAVAEES